MSNPNGLRTVLLMIPPMFLLLPFSLLIVALERISNTLLFTHVDREWRSGASTISLYGPTSSNSSDSEYTDVNVRIRYEPTLAVLALCVAAAIVSAFGICGIWELRRIEGTARHQRVWSWVMLVVNFLTAVASIGVLAYASSLQAHEKKWTGYDDVGNAPQTFTRETWVCQIDEFYPRQDWAGPACALEKATRFLLIPLAISAALVILCTWILVRDRGGAKWLVGGKGRYGGFDSVYEMRPQRQ